jgi:hypothetical protein
MSAKISARMPAAAAIVFSIDCLAAIARIWLMTSCTAHAFDQGIFTG